MNFVILHQFWAKKKANFRHYSSFENLLILKNNKKLMSLTSVNLKEVDCILVICLNRKTSIYYYFYYFLIN